jgi:predicted ATPase
MTYQGYKSEIRDSIIRGLLDKVRKRNYQKYLLSVRLEKIRLFKGSQINFEFPVTALIGPNGSGKSTILGAAACAYDSFDPSTFFQKSRVGDTSMDNWSIEYETIDKNENPTGTLRSNLVFENNAWTASPRLRRVVKFLSINRTVPATQSHLFMRRWLQRERYKKKTASLSVNQIDNFDLIRGESERILGKSLADFKLLELTITVTDRRPRLKQVPDSFTIDENGNQIPLYKIVGVKNRKLTPIKQLLYVGGDGRNEYSELNFGSGESSVIRMVAEIESLPSYSLVLIDELENGLHPLAVQRMVEYLIDVSRRRNIQAIFTTHSDYALTPLPTEAIWASVDGILQQGKLSVEVLRVVSGRIDRKLAIFVEDEFAKTWVEAVLRERLSSRLDEIGIYSVSGDGNAVKVHLGHISNPAIPFHSLCFIDGDSKQKDDINKRIFRLPGLAPESTVFNSVLANLDNNIALLTIACQRSLDKQSVVASEIKTVSRTNRDTHLLFNQIGLRIGFVPESVVKGAFLAVWIQENESELEEIVKPILKALELPHKDHL